MIHYYFGKGKGKTSAAVGACIRAAGSGLRRVIAGAYQVIVLDELGDAVQKHAVDAALVETVLALPDTEIVMTGHKCAEQFMQCADYITEFQCIAHPYQKGQKARKGFEF